MKTILNSFLRISLAFAMLALFTESRISGQDVILKKNGDEIKAKVEQVLDKEIKYKKFDNLSGPIYSVSKAEVFMIRYENGTKDVFGDQPAAQPAQQQAPQYVPPPQTSKSKITADDLRPAKTGMIINYALIAPILAAGAGAAFADDSDAQITAGAIATGIAAIGIPIGAIITSGTRKNTGVEGYRGVRIAGWIGYGLTIVDAVTMLALSEDVDFSGGPAFSVAILGALSTTFFAIDAGETIRQAKSLQSSFNIKPTIGIMSDVSGNKIKTIGFQLNF